MTAYRFLFKRLVDQYCYHEIEADSLEEAEEQADQIQDLAGSDEDVTNLQWQDDEVHHAEYGYFPVRPDPGVPVVDCRPLLQAIKEREEG